MKTEKDLLLLLSQLNIETKTFEHEPLFTVEQAKKVAHLMPGGHCKNLFLKDKKDNKCWLVVAHADSRVPLKELGKYLNSSGLHFAKPEILKEYLGVDPGSVTPLALINDTKQQVTVILDDTLLSYDVLNFHPLRNDATMAISIEDLKKFISYLENRILVISMDSI